MKIPLKKIQEGIEASKASCNKHLAAAETLAKNGQADMATTHIEFAIEEYGKATYLKDRVDKKSEDVDEQIRTSHDFKYNWAWTILPTQLKTIYENTIGVFDPKIFDSKIFDSVRVEKETISPDTRLNATFVDYDEKNREWKTGIRADSKKILEIVQEIRNHISKPS